MGLYRVPATIEWPGKGSPGVNVWSVRTTSDPLVVGELTAAISAIRDFYNAFTFYLAAGTKVTVGPDIVNRESLADANQPALTVQASSATDLVSPALQLVVGWKTALRARRGMGRTFLGPLNRNADGGDGTPAPNFVTAAQGAADGLISASDTANGWAVGVWGLQNKGAYDANGQLLPDLPHVHRDFISAKIRDQFAVLRSRRD